MEETEKSQENANPDGNNEAGDDEIGECYHSRYSPPTLQTDEIPRIIKPCVCQWFVELQSCDLASVGGA